MTRWPDRNVQTPRVRAFANVRGTAAVLVLVVTACPAAAGDDPGLTIAILDLAEAPAVASPPPSAQAQRPAWRTSFGSERRSESQQEAAPATGRDPLSRVAHTDAVLIQGVKAAGSLRRLFPPRSWRLIVSKRFAMTAASAGSGGAEPRAVTAIAVKARPGLRITARSHALRLDEGPVTGQSEEKPAEPVLDDATLDDEAETSHRGNEPARPYLDDRASNPPSAPLPVAAIAVRLSEGGRNIWIASVVLPPSCLGDAAAGCPARDGLEAWRRARRAQNEATIVGGRLVAAGASVTDRGAGTEAGSAPAACSVHSIEADLKITIQPAAAAGMLTDEATDTSGHNPGCVSIVRVSN